VSVHLERQPDGAVVAIVRWRQGGRNRSKRFHPAKFGGRRAAERAAREYDAGIHRAQALGGLEILDRGRVTFAEYAEAWWSRYASRRLAGATLDSYAGLLDRLLIPRWGAWPLREITPRAIEEWIADLHDAQVGDPTILRALAVMSGVLKRAVVDQELTANPVAAVDKPRQRRTRDPRPLAPAVVERIRQQLLAAGQVGDATLVSLLAYAGPRPESEGVTLEWQHVRRRTLLLCASKKHGAQRTVRQLEPLGEDLAEWRRHIAETTGAVPAAGLAFPFADGHVAARGRAWTGEDWDNWRDRVFRPAAIAAGVPADAVRRIKRRTKDGAKTELVESTSARPRDLRGSFATLLIYEGQPVTYVAEQLGNSPVVCLREYGGVFDEYDPSDRVDADVAIRRARAALDDGQDTAAGAS
jgi:site-specific recombinase XerD